MKDFDIEKLKRENVFTEPIDFYESMQTKVLSKTVIVEPKRARIIKLKWTYGAAAALALIFGLSVFTNSNNEVETEFVVQSSPTKESAVNNTVSISKPLNKDAQIEEIPENNLTLVAENNPRVIEKPELQKASFATPKKAVIVQNPEIQVDQILASFTSADLADLGKNAEQDVYLDLYN